MHSTFPARAWCAPGVLIIHARFYGSPLSANGEEHPRIGDTLTPSQMGNLARLALDGITKEFPNKPSNVITGPDRILSPRAMHPAFYGCFDWHSSVHGHRMLIRLLRLYPKSPVAPDIATLLDRQLTRSNMAAEARYFKREENHSFERMYGWAGALRLAAELHQWDVFSGHYEGEHWLATFAVYMLTGVGSIH